MIVGICFTLIFLIILVYDFKKGIILATMSLQFVSYLGTGFEGVKIFSVVCACAIPLFFYKKTELSAVSYPLPLIIASIFFCVSYTATLIHSNWLHFPTVFANVITIFIYPYIFWKCLKTRKEVKFAFDVFYHFMILAVFWGGIELIFRYNFIFNFVESLFVFEDFTIDASTIRYGMKRCNSFFSYFTTYGIACFIAFFLFFVKGRFGKDNAHNNLFLAACCFIAALTTGSRAIILGIFILLVFLVFDSHFLKSKSGAILVFLVILLSPVVCTIIYQIADSIINSGTSKYAVGSSKELRLEQWMACEQYFLNSPFFGNGRMYIWDVVKPAHPIVLGAESIWFSTLVDYGLLGAFAFIFLIFACMICLWKYSRRLICLPIGYLIILSLSPEQGIQYNMLITTTLLTIRFFRYDRMKKTFRGIIELKQYLRYDKAFNFSRNSNIQR